MLAVRAFAGWRRKRGLEENNHEIVGLASHDDCARLFATRRDADGQPLRRLDEKEEKAEEAKEAEAKSK